ncbi:hypothetical protein VE03_10201 [Pseudogymnoascus sp. 23342-1-I1]|nr:hypothetical protein VE03_10201 [Pseudogymnoascus sp. 23342-1-I1]
MPQGRQVAPKLHDPWQQDRNANERMMRRMRISMPDHVSVHFVTRPIFKNCSRGHGITESPDEEDTEKEDSVGKSTNHESKEASGSVSGDDGSNEDSETESAVDDPKEDTRINSIGDGPEEESAGDSCERDSEEESGEDDCEEEDSDKGDRRKLKRPECRVVKPRESKSRDKIINDSEDDQENEDLTGEACNGNLSSSSGEEDEDSPPRAQTASEAAIWAFVSEEQEHRRKKQLLMDQGLSDHRAAGVVYGVYKLPSKSHPDDTMYPPEEEVIIDAHEGIEEVELWADTNHDYRKVKILDEVVPIADVAAVYNEVYLPNATAQTGPQIPSHDKVITNSKEDGQDALSQATNGRQ